jgi:hypothetical protein
MVCLIWATAEVDITQEAPAFRPVIANSLTLDLAVVVMVVFRVILDSLVAMPVDSVPTVDSAPAGDLMAATRLARAEERRLARAEERRSTAVVRPEETVDLVDSVEVVVEEVPEVLQAPHRVGPKNKSATKL